MEYNKPSLTMAEQADLVISRGMICDRDELINHLNNVSYYRLSGYWYGFKNSDDSFVPRTNFSVVWNTYTFDRQFRLLVLDAIERVEVFLRTNLAYYLSQKVKAAIASKLGVHWKVLISWIGCLNTVRNLCAHHARLWNRELGTRPKIPKDEQWHQPYKIEPYRMFGVLTILSFILETVAPQTNWRLRLLDLFETYPAIPKHHMGFTGNWENSLLWKKWLPRTRHE